MCLQSGLNILIFPSDWSSHVSGSSASLFLATRFSSMCIPVLITPKICYPFSQQSYLYRLSIIHLINQSIPKPNNQTVGWPNNQFVFHFLHHLTFKTGVIFYEYGLNRFDICSHGLLPPLSVSNHSGHSTHCQGKRAEWAYTRLTSSFFYQSEDSFLLTREPEHLRGDS